MSDRQARHNQAAPIWAVVLIITATVGVSTAFIDLGGFWNGYVLDVAGPAWNYILFRGLAHAYADNFWTRFFTPGRTLLIFISVAYGIEAAQYFKLYDATYDPWDLLAYVSLLVPLFLVDVWIQRKP